MIHNSHTFMFTSNTHFQDCPVHFNGPLGSCKVKHQAQMVDSNSNTNPNPKRTAWVPQHNVLAAAFAVNVPPGSSL